jgi:hypothetical protein
MENLSDQVRLLMDRLEIDDLLCRYSVAIDTKNWDLLAEVFTPDAKIDYTSSQGIQGRFPEVAAWLEKSLTQFPMNQHMLGNRHIELNGDSGTGRTYFFNPNSLADEAGVVSTFFVGGYYLDRFVRTPEGWRIEDRYEEGAWVYSDEPLESIVERIQGK